MEKAPFYKKSWFVIILILLMPYFGIPLLWYYKKFNKTSRVVLSVIGIIIFINIISPSPSNFESGKEAFKNEKWEKSIQYFKKVSDTSSKYERSKYLLKKAKHKLHLSNSGRYITEGLEHINDNKYSKALKILRKVPEESSLYNKSDSLLSIANDSLFETSIELIKAKKYEKAEKYLKQIKNGNKYKNYSKYLSIAQNEQNLDKKSHVYIKSEKANLRRFPSTESKIDTTLRQNKKLISFYELGNWTRVHQNKEENLIFPDSPELDGWIYSSLLESPKEHEIRKEKLAKKRRREYKKEKQEAYVEFIQWAQNYLDQSNKYIEDISSFSVDKKMKVFNLFLSTTNKIYIKNLGLDAAYSCRKHFGSKQHISVRLYIGRVKVGNVEWSGFKNKFVCELEN